MNDFVARLSVALLLPSAVLVWRHSRIVSVAIIWPFVASIYIAARAIDLPVEHPARVLVPVVSMMLGFAEAYAEGFDGKNISRAALLGVLVFASGGADVAALPTFAVFHGWAIPWLQTIVCLALIVVSTVPQRRFPWLISSLS